MTQPTARPPRFRHLLTALVMLGFAGLAAASEALPPEVRQALRRTGVPESALSVVIQPAGGRDTRLGLQSRTPVNPASLTKLVTTYMALDRLGPAWTWPTPLQATGPVRDGVLDGDLVIEGRGDPTLVIERLWQGLLALRQAGIETIRGDIVLDRRAFVPSDASPADFDGDPTRPYNVLPDALLLNYHAALWTFEPDPASGRARISRDVDLPLQPPGGNPPGAGRPAPRPALNPSATNSVPLAPGPCGDWRGSLRIEPSGADWRPRGAYPTACKVQTWPLAAADPQAFGERLMADLWRAVGGRLEGRVRSLQRAGSVSDPPPRQATVSDATGSDAGPRWVWRSPPLAQVVRDINKFSNNVMAQQLFLTLGALPDAEDAPEAGSAAEPRALRSGVAAAPPWPRPATPQAARDAMRRWAAQRLGEPAAGEFVIDNGSGLSRETRVTAQWLARLLQHAWASPVMPEFLASLPITGIDGTMRRSRASPGRAHLKTGSLRDVIARAGYVLDDRGQRHVFVAIIQHPNAQAARPVLDALVDWTMRAEGGETASKSTKTAPATKAAQTTPTAREKQARRTPTESGSRAPR